MLSRIKPTLNHPLPMTLRQLRRFFESQATISFGFRVMGNLPGLYINIVETQQAQTKKLVWSPDIQKAFKVLQTALLQAPTLSLPTGSEFNLFVTERKGVAFRILPHP